MDFMPAVVPYLGAMGMGVFEFALGFYLFSAFIAGWLLPWCCW